MSADQIFPDSNSFAQYLRKLKLARDQRVASQKQLRGDRTSLTIPERAEVLLKSGGRCHICGGTIAGEDWQVDHVFAHSAGGTHSLENYLAAHSICNNYRWHYDTEEFQWILKLGVWLRTQIENQTTTGTAAGTDFVAHDRHRARRRKHPQPLSQPNSVTRAATPKAPGTAPTGI